MFSHEGLKNQTALSKYFWKLKNNCLSLELQWRISKRSTTLSCFDGRYNSCLEEKIQIMLYFYPGNLLNQGCDLIIRCSHKNKFRRFSNNYVNNQVNK